MLEAPSNIDDERVADAARYFVDAGRVVPGIIVDAGGPARSQWWPLPAAGDREFLRALVSDDSPDGHREVATSLAVAVDRLVRERTTTRGAPLAPRRAGRRTIPVRANCSCPDSGNPCKHIAAVLYVFADLLDADPWLLLTWRGRTRDEVLAHVRALAPADAFDHGLPAWWPLTPGRAQQSDLQAAPPIAEPPVPPDRVLHRLQPLGVDVAGTAFEPLLARLYDAITQPLEQPTE
jgi:SWIM zinc finger